MDSIRILLVEDNPADTRLIREALADSQPQHFIEHRTDLAAGLRRLVERGIDCVLLDLTLPRQSRPGHVPAPYMRRCRRQPIIILSACENDELGAPVRVQSGRARLSAQRAS